MPYHSNSPQKNLNDLYKILFEMERFGILSQDFYQPINTLMASIYPDVINAYEDANAISGEDDWATMAPDAIELWPYVDDADKEQFIEDFRNVMYACFFNEAYLAADEESTVEQIISMRNIDRYREDIKVDTDADTQQKYANMKRTVWFPEDMSPTKIGIYEVSSESYVNPLFCGYASWNGKHWSSEYPLLSEAIAITKKENEHKDWYSHCWRGFAEEV